MSANTTLPDATCVAAGDEYLGLAMRCFAAGGVSDRGIVNRIIARLGLTWAETPADRTDDAAWAIARHAALEGLPERQILAQLCWLATELPATPDDPEELAWIANAALAECAA